MPLRIESGAAHAPAGRSGCIATGADSRPVTLGAIKFAILSEALVQALSRAARADVMA
jgi:hypothetical protein